MTQPIDQAAPDQGDGAPEKWIEATPDDIREIEATVAGYIEGIHETTTDDYAAGKAEYIVDAILKSYRFVRR